MSAISMKVGQVATMKIVGLDQFAVPIAFTPDSPPTWASTGGAGTLVVAADGLSATETANVEGVDQVTATIIVGGATFTASQELDISAVVVVPVLTSFRLDTTVA